MPPKRAAAGDWYYRVRELYFGIPVIVSFTPSDPKLADEIWTYLESVDDLFNDYREDSEVGRINAAADRSDLKISADMAAALLASLDVHRKTGGAFDITIGPLRRLWKSAAKSGRRPTEAKIDEARRACGMERVKVAGDRLSVTSAQVKLDFGGIIKGIAVDRVMDKLKQAGARSALIQIGGETAAFGHSRKSGGPHTIGVQHPTDMQRIWQVIADPGTGLSAATSGNYRNPIMIEGRAYYHIFDPRTGRPVDTHTLSVSIVFGQIGKNGLADGLCTAGAVLGHEKALPLIRKLGGEALFLVAERGKIVEHKTDGWDAFVRKE